MFHLSCNLIPVTDTMQHLRYMPHNILSLPLPPPPDLGLHTKTFPTIFNHGDIFLTKDNTSPYCIIFFIYKKVTYLQNRGSDRRQEAFSQRPNRLVVAIKGRGTYTDIISHSNMTLTFFPIERVESGSV